MNTFPRTSAALSTLLQLAQMREVVKFQLFGLWLLANGFMLACTTVLGGPPGAPIDRYALVARHNITLRNFDTRNPLTVGNGHFAFTVDTTGLQTFPETVAETTPLCTLSDWGWHTAPNTNGWSLDRFQFTSFPDLHGRPVPYADVPGNRQTPEIRWLRGNPHRLHLGQLGFVLAAADGGFEQLPVPQQVEQTLDLWTGSITSRFELEHQAVEVQTICHPERDLLGVRVTSPLIRNGRLAVQIRFPYGTGAPTAADWTKSEAHRTLLQMTGPSEARFSRTLDGDRYFVIARWSPGVNVQRAAPHRFLLAKAKPAPRQPAQPGVSETLEFTCEFLPQPQDLELPGFESVATAAREHWNAFWKTGGAIDLSGSRDPRWFELERRIVLSQYLTAAQGAENYPPQETGLTCNSWEGKFHLEMHFWHAAHFALWGRLPLLERSLGYYDKIRPRAEATAKKQGYAGARWPKMTSPDGTESPSPVGPFLIWQEPHPIFFAELCWREHRDRPTLERFRNVVFATADFMASYPSWDEATGRYVLGPTLQCAQEIFPRTKTLNPTFELSYWRWGLETAQRWRERLGLRRDPKWDAVLHSLAQPTVADGRYLFAESAPDSYLNPRWRTDHPAVVGALSFLPGPGIDPNCMRPSLDWVWENWNWAGTWGWDYPLIAMCAARLGQPERAVDALLRDTPKNRYSVNGHVFQRPNLSVYLPANGGLLYAAALMAAGWEGAPKRNAPGFPDNGRWNVRWENLRLAP